LYRIYPSLKELEKQITGQKTFSSFACSLMKTGGYSKVLNSPGPANSFDSERFKRPNQLFFEISDNRTTG
jgi:hypothetical protein